MRCVALLSLRLVVIAALLLPRVALSQVFQSQGPGPRIGSVIAAQSADATPNGTEAGAIQAVLVDPALGPNTIYAASVNGGIWVTNNGGQSWTPLTDKQSSLSIGSLALDSTDASGKTIVAGVAITSNGGWDQFNTPFQGRGGQQTGVLYTTNGGQTWSDLGATALAGQSVISAQARGSTILAATFEEQSVATTATGGGAQYGLYRSTNGGATFTLVSGTGGTGLPAGAVTSLVADPSSSSRFYAAVTSVTTPNQTAIYVTNNTGATWTPVFTQTQAGSSVISNTQQTVLTLATGPSGAVAVAVSNVGANPATFSALFLSQDNGATWHKSTVTPNVIPGGQTPVNLHIAIDPNNTNIVYVTGDATTTCFPCTIAAFRVQYSANLSSSTATSLTFEGTGPTFADANTIHADSRALAFDSSGRLIVSSDGGIYIRNNPQGAGTWQGLNGNLSVFEPYTVAYDANSKRAGVAAQDNGVSFQSAPGSPFYNAIHQGDGINIVINDRTLPGESAIYTSSQNLGILSRMIVNSQGQAINPFPDATNPAGIPITCNGGNDCSTQVTGTTFSSPFVLNRIDPTMIAIGGSRIYVTSDPLAGANDVNANTVDLTLTDLGGTGNSVTTIAYGTQDNVNALVAGNASKDVYRSTTGATGSLVRLPQYNLDGGLIPTSIVFDPRSSARFFVADSANLWSTVNGTAVAPAVAFLNQTANLPAGFIRPSSVEFISNNGVNALLVGGLNAPLTCTTAPNGCVISSQQSPITVADSDAFGNLSNWRAFGQGLPNALITQMAYNAAVDVLVTGAVGRGVFLLYDVTSNFPQALVLQFGLADNNSNPDASLLTNGTNASRPLAKYGTGTLTIAGDATYTGGTTIFGGIMQIGTGGTSGSILGNVAFCGDAGNALCDTSNNKFLVFNRSDTYTFNGAISGPGQVVQNGTGRTILTANSTYTGPTIINSGLLSVNGSIASSVFVNNGGMLGGNGSVGPTTVNLGGALAPGNSVGTITINGSLLFTPGSFYLVEVLGSTADRTNVTSTATLAGTVVSMFQGGTLARTYTILSASGGLSGTFNTLTTAGLPNFLTATLGYSATDVTLNLSSGFALTPGLTRNQSAVASALDNAFKTGSGIPGGLNNLFNLSAGQLPSALDALSGEAYASEQSVLIDDSRYVRQAVLGRLRQIPYDSRTAPSGALSYTGDTQVVHGDADDDDDTALAYAKKKKRDKLPKFPVNDAPAPAPASWRDLTFWTQGFGAWGHFNSDGNAADINRSLGGFMSGADAVVGSNWQVGLAAGYSQSITKITGRASSTQADGGHFAGYAGTSVGDWSLRTGAAYSLYNINTNRSIIFAGFNDSTRVQYNAGAGQLFAEVGRAVMISTIAVEPYAGLAWVHLNTAGFTETGGVASLSASSNGADVGYSTLGLRAATNYVMPNGVIATPRVGIAWQHAFGDLTPTSQLAFANTTGANFTVAGVPLSRDSALIEAGADVRISRQAKVGISYSAQLANSVRDNSVKGNFTWNF